MSGSAETGRRPLGRLTLVVALVLSAVGTEGAAAARTLYAAGNGNAVSAHVIGADGPLATIGAPVATGNTPNGMAIAPDGAHAYVTNTNSDNISPYAISADGTLTSLAMIGTPADPNGIAVAPSGDHLYVSTAAGVAGYSIAADGLLSPFGAPLDAGLDQQGLAITPDGRFLYSANRNSDTVSSYSIATDGSLTPLGAPINHPLGSEPVAAVVRPSGTHLYIVNLDSDRLTSYAIGADGTLSAIAAPIATGDGPYGIAASPNGNSLYVANAFSHNVTAYSIGADGVPNQLGASVASGMEPSGIAVTPDGRFLYNTNFLSQDVSAFELTQEGNPIGILGSPFAALVGGLDFQSLAIRPNQAPQASLSVAAVVPGSVRDFDASASTDPEGSVARYDWDFGDGSTLADGGPTPTHAYAAPGTYIATVTVTDNEGCSSSLVFTGQTAHCNGGPAAVASQSVVVPDTSGPVLTLKVKKKQSAEKPIKLVAACDEPCELIAKGKIKLGKDDSAKAKKATGQLAANDPGKLKLKLNKKNAEAVEDATGGGDKIKASIKVRATDAAGNSTTETAKAKLK